MKPAMSPTLLAACHSPRVDDPAWFAVLEMGFGDLREADFIDIRVSSSSPLPFGLAFRSQIQSKLLPEIQKTPKSLVFSGSMTGERVSVVSSCA
jgi:hypothetical protein